MQKRCAVGKVPMAASPHHAKNIIHICIVGGLTEEGVGRAQPYKRQVCPKNLFFCMFWAWLGGETAEWEYGSPFGHCGSLIVAFLVAWS